MYVPPPELKVNWAKGRDGWLFLDNLNLQDSLLNDIIGVYILWNSKEVIKLGSGCIREELAKDKTNQKIMTYENLMVTWCKLEADQIEGVKSYLMENKKPRITEKLIEVNVTKRSLNLPW